MARSFSLTGSLVREAVRAVARHKGRNGLNALGVSPRDMISILQALKTAGAIQADIEVM